MNLDEVKRRAEELYPELRERRVLDQSMVDLKKRSEDGRLYGIWFEKSGWWAEVQSDIMFVTSNLNVAIAQMLVLIRRNVGRYSGANMPDHGVWYNKPCVAEIASLGEPGERYAQSSVDEITKAILGDVAEGNDK